MSTQEKERLESLKEAVLNIPPGEQNWVLGFAEGMAYVRKQTKEAAEAAEDKEE